MSHLLHNSYGKLIDRINRFPQGAPSSHLLYKILQILFSQKEADLVSLLPIKPFTAEKASKIWKKDITSSKKILDELASRAILFDFNFKNNDKQFYILPPPMAGFLEFSMMRIRDDIDQKFLSELLYQYINVEDDFVKALFLQGETQFGRVLVHEPAIDDVNTLEVLDFEKASEIIKTAEHIGMTICYCRHKMHHLNKACNAPMDICMTLNMSAAFLIKHGFARKVDATECIENLHRAYEYNLVQFAENVRKNTNFICNCCSCCCDAMTVAKRFGLQRPVHTTNFLPEIKHETCTGCGKCADICPVGAISLVSDKNSENRKSKKAVLDEKICLGCALCKKTCPSENIRLLQRKERIIPPYNTIHRTVAMAIERGTLENLIFDNRIMFNHRAFSAVLGAIFKLSPIKRAMMSKQIKSRFLETISSRFNI